MHLRLLPEKGKYKFRGVKMEMLVTKFSNGKYRNEGELFDEPISVENVKLMGEMIALQSLRTVKKFDMKVADRLYIGLIKDLHHMGEIDYIVSDGYDVAQTAICFLYQFVGRRGTIVESIDFTNYKALPADPVNCFEPEQTDYSKYDTLIEALHLTELELAILNCYMNGMRQGEVCAELGIGRGIINHRKASIRKRYNAYFNTL